MRLLFAGASVAGLVACYFLADHGASLAATLAAFASVTAAMTVAFRNRDARIARDDDERSERTDPPRVHHVRGGRVVKAWGYSDTAWGRLVRHVDAPARRSR